MYFRMYLHVFLYVFACILSVFLPQIHAQTYLHPAVASRNGSLARWCAVAARSLRGRCGKFVARAAQAQAKNQQIYLDQIRSTGQLQPEATLTAATMLRVDVPCRCWLPVVDLEAKE